MLSGTACLLIYGMYSAILLWRKVAQKRISPKLLSDFQDQYRELLANKTSTGSLPSVTRLGIGRRPSRSW